MFKEYQGGYVASAEWGKERKVNDRPECFLNMLTFEARWRQRLACEERWTLCGNEDSALIKWVQRGWVICDCLPGMEGVGWLKAGRGVLPLSHSLATGIPVWFESCWADHRLSFFLLPPIGEGSGNYSCGQLSFLSPAASYTSNLTYSFYSHKLYAEACAISEPFCQHLGLVKPGTHPAVPPEKVWRQEGRLCWGKEEAWIAWKDLARTLPWNKVLRAARWHYNWGSVSQTSFVLLLLFWLIHFLYLTQASGSQPGCTLESPK